MKLNKIKGLDKTKEGQAFLYQVEVRQTGPAGGFQQPSAKTGHHPKKPSV